jgi:tetratricopeptide (TPR) repeat protein
VVLTTPYASIFSAPRTALAISRIVRRYHPRVTSEPEGKGAAAPEIRAAATPSSVRELAQEALRLARVDLRQAEATATAACDAAATLDDPTTTGLSFRCLANVRYLSGRLEEAIVLYQRALEAFASGNDEIEGAKTRSSGLQTLILLGRYDHAQSWAAAAREVFVRHRDPLLVARLDCNLGNLLHRLDRHREALAAYETSLRFFRAHGGDPQATAAALLNSAVCLIILGDLPEAEARFIEMSAHCRRNGMPLPALQAEYNLAYLHFHRGEYTRAIEHYRAAVERSREQGDIYHEALCRLDLAEIYLDVNLTAEAAELAEQARAAFAGLKLRYEASKATAFAAIAAGQRGESDSAAALFAEARRGFDAEGNHAWCAMVDFYRAIALLEARRPEDARREANRARDWFLDAGQTPRVVLAELLLARAELALGSYGDASRHAVEARRRLEQLDSPHLLYRASFVDGQIAEASGDRATALERYRDACTVLGGLRAHLHSEELLIAFVKDKQAVFESLIWLTLETMEPGSGADALAWVENAKSRAFADMIAPRSIGPQRAGRAPSGLKAEMRLLREELNWCYSQLDAADIAGNGPSEGGGEALLGRGVATGTVDDLRRRSRQLEGKLIKVTNRLRSRDLDFDALESTGISVEAVRAALPDDTLLLEYYEARGIVFAFVVGRDRIEVRPVSSSERVRRLLGFLQFQLSKLQLGEAYVRTFDEALLLAVRSHLRELDDELIAPVRSLLDARSLIVVPHGPLHRVPFQALWNGESYLVDHFALSYAPSASVFRLCSMRPARPTAGALILAVPDDYNPGLAAEAGVVASAMPGARVLLGDQATPDALRQWGGGAGLIHVAAHGFFRRDNPMFSAIQLGGASRLTVLDLYELDLASELVVLSGCGTGLGGVEGGDEQIGLVRGLLYAGAQTVVATLWDAQDESTRRFMQAFYQRLQAQPDRAAALRDAMVELRDAYPHPYYWAPFFLAGRPSGRPLLGDKPLAQG